MPGGDTESLITYGIGVLVLIFLLVAGIVKWKRFVYWFEEGELRIEYGLFVKKKRYIPFERIQSLDYTEGLFHRPLGLVRVKVETAGGGQIEGAEAELTAISRRDAERIEEEMERVKAYGHLSADEAKQANDPAIGQSEEVRQIYRISGQELLVLAATSGGIGVILSGIAIFLSQFSEVIPYESIYSEIMIFLRFGILIVALALFVGLLLIWFVSLILTVMSNYRFTVMANEENIIITRGLLEKKRVTIPFKRIQAIHVTQNPLREILGYTAVTVESAGGTVSEMGNDKIRLLPLVKKHDMLQVLETLFPEMEWAPELMKAPVRSVHFFYRFDFIWLLPAAGVLSYFFFPYGLLALLALPVSVALGIWQHRTAGWMTSDKQLTLQFRAFGKHTFYMLKKRVQAIEIKQSWFQRRKNVASVQATVKSGAFGAAARAEHLEQQDAHVILQWFRPKKRI
ncbi:PH domain-containing protein [Planococcus lenghuensis]|uniref:PH domain-containing protein n=1 Tax=Planococcus lenghuensis TaxID=2213202 RepID=UPI001E3F0A3E|nr:PH domain-containing protein [Planococcus lenghuensis]